MLYADLCAKLSHPKSLTWLKATFADCPTSVAVVVCPYPDEGAAQWFVETDAVAKEVATKLGTKSRVWTLTTAQDYLSCFGVTVGTVKEAALLFDREEYATKGGPS